MHRSISIDFAKCKQPCLVCDQVVPGIRERAKKGPLTVQGWAWLEQSGRVQLLIDSCPCGAVSVTNESDRPDAGLNSKA